MYKIYKTQQGKITNPERISDYCWVDISYASEEDLMKLRSIIDVPEDILVSIRDTNEVPKVEKEEDFDFILIQTPVESSQAEDAEVSYSIMPLGIIYTSKMIVTISKGENEVIDYLKLKLKNYSKNNIVDTKNVPQFILKLLLFSAKIHLRYLKIINQRIHTAQDNFDQAPQNDEIINLMHLEKSLVYFETSLHSNHIVFEKLAKRKFFASNEDDQELTEDIIDENKQALETVKIYSKIVTNVSTTFASIISNNLNSTMKSLTAITLILMIPTVIASIYGMNVQLPFQDLPYAFGIIIAISAVLAFIGTVIFFTKKIFR